MKGFKQGKSMIRFRQITLLTVERMGSSGAVLDQRGDRGPERSYQTKILFGTGILSIFTPQALGV